MSGVEELTIRELATRSHVHWRTVRQALASAVPPPPKAAVRPAPKLEGFKPAIEAMLRSDLTRRASSGGGVRAVAQTLAVSGGQGKASASACVGVVKPRVVEGGHSARR
jgi:hypothetical protein